MCYFRFLICFFLQVEGTSGIFFRNESLHQIGHYARAALVPRTCNMARRVFPEMCLAGVNSIK